MFSLSCSCSYSVELAGGTENFCKSMSMLASCEENTALARAFSQLAETQEKVGLLQHDQAEKDFFIFSEMLRDYLCLIAAVKVNLPSVL
jgi:sorting nexin-1/2